VSPKPYSAYSTVVNGSLDPLIIDVLLWGPLDDGEGRDTELRDLIAELVDSLPEDERTVIEALFWEGLSARQLAVRLGVSRSAVQTLLTRATTRMKDALSVPDPTD